VSWNLHGVTVFWQFNARGAHIECIQDRYETANIPLSNGNNIMHFCSVFVKIWFGKYSDNLYAPCISVTSSTVELY
jgi:hypothetical protein